MVPDFCWNQNAVKTGLIQKTVNFLILYVKFIDVELVDQGVFLKFCKHIAKQPSQKRVSIYIPNSSERKSIGLYLCERFMLCSFNLVD